MSGYNQIQSAATDPAAGAPEGTIEGCVRYTATKHASKGVACFMVIFIFCIGFLVSFVPLIVFTRRDAGSITVDILFGFITGGGAVIGAFVIMIKCRHLWKDYTENLRGPSPSGADESDPAHGTSDVED